MAHPALPPSTLQSSLQELHEASYGWARSCCDGDPDEAADVLQSAYVKVLSGNASYEGRSTFRTWLFGVIRLTALEQRRRSGRELSLDSQTEPESLAQSIDAVLLEAEEARAIRSALTQLPARQQEILHLVFQQDMSIAEAALVMGVSIGSARVHYDRGKKKMRALLSDNARTDDD